MAADGQNTEQIARTLNLEHVPTPMQQKRMAGCPRKWHGIHEDNFWMRDTVGLILRDERYTGMNIFGKRIRDEIGNAHTVKNDRDKWIAVDNTHDGIVTREEFDRAQAQMRRYAEHPCRPGCSPFRKKVRCGVCGHTMARTGKKKPYYSCHTPRVTDAYACPVERVPEKDLADAVLKQLRMQALYAVNASRIWEEKRRLKKQGAGSIRKAISKMQESGRVLENHIREIYEKTVFGEMDKAEYLKEKNAASEKRDAIYSKIQELEAELQYAGADGKLENRFVDSFTKYTEVEKLTAEIVADVLQEIIVYPGGKINIVWNYRDEMEKLLLDISMGDGAGNTED